MNEKQHSTQHGLTIMTARHGSLTDIVEAVGEGTTTTGGVGGGGAEPVC